MNTDRLNGGLDALVRLHAHYASLAGGSDRLFENQQRAELAQELADAWRAGLVEVVVRAVEKQEPPRTSLPMNHYDGAIEVSPDQTLPSPPPSESPFPQPSDVERVRPARELHPEALNEE